MQQKKAHTDEFPTTDTGKERPLSRKEIAQLMKQITNNQLILPDFLALEEVQAIDKEVREILNMDNKH